MRSEHYLFCCRIDDGDGTPDIYDNEDDNNGIPTAMELQNHLDPFNPYEANGNIHHDGITDGVELRYWEDRLKEIHKDWSDERVLNMSVNYTP